MGVRLATINNWDYWFFWLPEPGSANFSAISGFKRSDRRRPWILSLSLYCLRLTAIRIQKIKINKSNADACDIDVQISCRYVIVRCCVAREILGWITRSNLINNLWLWMPLRKRPQCRTYSKSIDKYVYEQKAFICAAPSANEKK